MREHGWVTPGVHLAFRSGSRILARSQLFSSLNVDSAWAARRGHESLSRELAASAREIERGELVTAMIALLQVLPEQVVRDFLEGRIPPRQDFPRLKRLIELVAMDTSNRRRIVMARHGFQPEVLTDGNSVTCTKLYREEPIGNGTGQLLIKVTEVTESGQEIVDIFPAVILPEVEEEVNPFARTKEPLVLTIKDLEGLGVIVLDGIGAPEIVE